jgi:hypothetical protein
MGSTLITRIVFGAAAKWALELAFPSNAGYTDAQTHVTDVDPPDGGDTMRHLQVVFDRHTSHTAPEDVAVCGFDLMKEAAGIPDASWSDANYTTAETAFDAWWGSIHGQYKSHLRLKEYRWYLGGVLNVKPNPVLHLTPKNVAGTSTADRSLPPQAAISITERTFVRQHWGRFYLPAGDTNQCGTEGWISDSPLTTIATATNTLYDALAAAHMPAMVFSAAKPVRPQKHGADLPEQLAKAYKVLQVQVDDVFDVIRSRRYSNPSLRLEHTVAP